VVSKDPRRTARLAGARSKPRSSTEAPQTGEADIAKFVSRYSPEIAAQLRNARSVIRKLVPNGHELVYDNYNALVFAFGPTAKPSQLVVSVAGYPKWVTVFFARAARLDDPQRLLEGSGKSIRGIRLVPFQRLKSRPVQKLIREALAVDADSFAQAPRLTTLVRSVSARQRPRRPS
jgi:hypothetical protein